MQCWESTLITHLAQVGSAHRQSTTADECGSGLLLRLEILFRRRPSPAPAMLVAPHRAASPPTWRRQVLGVHSCRHQRWTCGCMFHVPLKLGWYAYMFHPHLHLVLWHNMFWRHFIVLLRCFAEFIDMNFTHLIFLLRPGMLMGNYRTSIRSFVLRKREGGSL
jgi:hypothetical protein